MIGVRRDADGAEFDMPDDKPIPPGFTPIESKGPLRGVVDTVNAGMSGARGATQGFINDLIRSLGGAGPSETTAGKPFDVGEWSPLANAAAGLVNPVPGSLGEAAVMGTQIATGRLPLPARLAAPPAVAGSVALASGESPMQAAERAGVALGSTALGEGTSGAVHFATRKYGQRATQGAAEAASGREAQGVSDAYRQVLPESAPYVGSAQDLLNMRDPGAILQMAKGKKEASDAAIVQALGPWAQQALDKIKQLGEDGRALRDSGKPVEARDLFQQAATLQEGVMTAAVKVDPGLAVQAMDANKTYRVVQDLLEITRAGTSRPGTENTAMLDTQGMRTFLQKNREDYPSAEYGPVFDALSLGRGQTTHKFPIPAFIGIGGMRERLPIGLGTVHRPGDSPGTQIPPAIFDILYGRALNSLPGR